MTQSSSARPTGAAYAAYVAAALFAIRLATFFLPHSVQLQVGDGTLPGALLGLAEHLVLFPVVAALPAPRWARAAGYGWLVVDMTTDIMALNGVPASIFVALRYGDHISAVLWTIAASWEARGATRIVGILYALNLGSYSFLAAYGVPALVLIPSAFLLPAWLILVGRLIARAEAPQAVRMPVSEQQPVS